jgi:hypothetical protein
VFELDGDRSSNLTAIVSISRSQMLKAYPHYKLGDAQAMGVQRM